MLAQTKLTVKQYYVVGTIRMGKCAYGVESKGNAIGEVNRPIVNWWRGSGFWGINRRIQYHTSRWRNWRGGEIGEAEMNAKTLVGILAGIVAFVAVVYYRLPKPGKAVLEAEVAAMNEAQSWRIRTEMHGMGGVVTRTHVAICPDKEHIVEEGSGAASEYIRIGDDIYWRKGATAWKRG